MIDTRQGRLLILDDDPAVGITIRTIAESANFDAYSTARADEFFRMLDAWEPTHIALDLVMPDVDGIEAILRLAAMKCQASIIITSGAGNRVLDAAERATIGHGLNVAGVLAKPFTPAKLRALLAHGPAAARPPDPPAWPVMYTDDQAPTERDLAEALDQGHLSVFYQPKIDCARGALAGFEGLVRWHHPQRGLIMPDRFIVLAEQSGLIDRLAEQVFDQALTWLATSFPDSGLLLSLNISARSLGDINLANRITAACHARGLDPTRIILEITETSAMSDPVTTLNLVTRFRIKGFQLSIDDFGIGYSSLIQLARLPFSELKIDKMFVTNAARSEESRKIILAVIGLGHSLGLRVTAEGVEDVETLDFLRHAGCDLAQGYFISKPQPGDAIIAWSRARGH